MEPHTDSDLLTMTYYDEPFLEVQQPMTEAWELIDVCNNLPIVNVGRRFQIASNCKLHAPVHRVKQTEKAIDLIMYDLHECPH
jgi:isopenicillin N synthase-like dioxygenase